MISPILDYIARPGRSWPIICRVSGYNRAILADRIEGQGEGEALALCQAAGYKLKYYAKPGPRHLAKFALKAPHSPRKGTLQPTGEIGIDSEFISKANE